MFPFNGNHIAVISFLDVWIFQIVKNKTDNEIFHRSKDNDGSLGYQFVLQILKTD